MSSAPLVPAPALARLYLDEPGSAIPADRPEAHPEPNLLAPAMGHGLAHLHRLAPGVSDGPTRAERVEGEAVYPAGRPARSVDHELMATIRARLDQGLIDPAALPEPYRRYRADRLVELAVDAPVGRVEVCWTHGRPTPAAFLIDNGRFRGFVGPCQAGLGDRHLDLAVAQLTIGRTLGAAAVLGFHEAYQLDVDLVRLDRAMLLALLAGLV